MVIEEAGKIAFGTAMTKAALRGYKGRANVAAYKAKEAVSKVGSSLKKKLAPVASKVGEKLSNAAFDARFKGRALMKRMRAKYGPHALANKIKRGYEGAKKWAANTALGQRVLKAYATGMAKKAGKLDQKAVDTAEKAKKAALAVNK
jgi:hypothetical protein